MEAGWEDTVGPVNRWHEAPSALPPALFALTGAGLYWAGRRDDVAVAAWVLLVLPVFGGAAVALCRRLPGWGFSYLGAAWMLVYVAITTLLEELADLGRVVVLPFGESILGLPLLLGGTLLLLTAARRGAKQAGLVGVGLASMFALVIATTLANPPFARPDLALMVVPAGLLFSALTHAYVRLGASRAVAALAGMWGLGMCIIVLACQVWRPQVAGRGKAMPLVPLSLLYTGLLLCGPVVHLLSRPLRRMTGQAAAG